MWPDEYINWGLRLRPLVVRLVHGGLARLLYPSPLPDEELARLAEQATHDTFSLAHDHCRYPDFFESEAQFRGWLGVVALREVIRRLLRHASVEPQLNLLASESRRILGMLYLDRLLPSDVASLIGTPVGEINRLAHEGMARLLERLRSEDN